MRPEFAGNLEEFNQIKMPPEVLPNKDLQNFSQDRQEIPVEIEATKEIVDKFINRCRQIGVDALQDDFLNKVKSEQVKSITVQLIKRFLELIDMDQTQTNLENQLEEWQDLNKQIQEQFSEDVVNPSDSYLIQTLNHFSLSKYFEIRRKVKDLKKAA